jgi:hypothetical protein
VRGCFQEVFWGTVGAGTALVIVVIATGPVSIPTAAGVLLGGAYWGGLAGTFLGTYYGWGQPSFQDGFVVAFRNDRIRAAAFVCGVVAGLSGWYIDPWTFELVYDLEWILNPFAPPPGFWGR